MSAAAVARIGSLAWLWISAVVVVLDQVTKQLASKLLTLYEPVELAPMLNFTLMHNRGAAFSMLSDAGGWQRWALSALAVGVSGFLIHWLRGIPRGYVLVPVALALVVGGAIGNLWDRIYLGVVVDFIDVHYQGWRWPAFNVADSAICIGAGMLIFAFITGRDPEPSRPPAEDS